MRKLLSLFALWFVATGCFGQLQTNSLAPVTGTTSSPLLNVDTGKWSIFIHRVDGTTVYTANSNPLPFGGPSQGAGGLRVDVNTLTTNNDQAFAIGGWIYCGALPAPNAIIPTNVKVGGGFYSWRGTGAPNCGTMGINPSVSFNIDSTQADEAVEANFNNGSGVNYSIGTTVAAKDGVVSASGGANRPRWAFRSGNTQGVNNAWDGGMILRGWYTEGLLVKPESYSVGTVAIESQYIGNAATSLGTQTNSGDICDMSNRWNGSAAVFDRWCLRAVPKGDGTGSHWDFVNPQNGTSTVQVFDSFNGQAAIFGSGVLAAQFPGSTTITNFDTTAPGLRITPVNDTAGTAVQLTNAANSVNNLLIDKTGGINITGPSSFLKIKDQGSCTMATGTCSAQSLSHTYAVAPLCFVTWNGTGALTGIAKCPSTTTTVTPASSVGTDTAVMNWFVLGS